MFSLHTTEYIGAVNNGKLPFNLYGLHSFLCRILEILQGTIVKSLYPYPIFSLIMIIKLIYRQLLYC